MGEVLATAGLSWVAKKVHWLHVGPSCPKYFLNGDWARPVEGWEWLSMAAMSLNSKPPGLAQNALCSF